MTNTRRTVWFDDESWFKLRQQALQMRVPASDLIRLSTKVAQATNFQILKPEVLERLAKVMPKINTTAISQVMASMKPLADQIKATQASMGNHHHFELTNDQVAVTVNNPPAESSKSLESPNADLLADPELDKGLTGFVEALDGLMEKRGYASDWMYALNKSKVVQAWKDQHAKD